jgi:ectoine hydroxylase-related dioxygenase (phytanoyl-CoA dioxygenase family)
MQQSTDTELSEARFHHDGYHVWRDFLTPEAVERLRTEAERLLASDIALHTPESIRVFQLFRHGEAFVELLEDDRLSELTDPLLGRNALMSDFSLNSVGPNGKPDRWHIDYPYNDMRHIAEGSLLALQCVLPLTPFTEESGATQFLPGTHQRYRQPTLSPAGTPVSALADPGDLLILPAATWHRAGVNHGTAPRTAILFSFIESWIRPMAEAPEAGPWSRTRAARIRLGMERG